MQENICDRCGADATHRKGETDATAVTILQSAPVDPAGAVAQDVAITVRVTCDADLCDTCQAGAIAARMAALPNVSDAAKQVIGSGVATAKAVQG